MSTLTPSAVSGSSVIFTADSAIFITADIGRIIIAGNGRATIIGLGPSAGASGSPNAVVRANITANFASTATLADPDWRLSVRLTPAAISGTGVIFTADSAVFFSGDIGRYIISGQGRALIVGLGPSAGSSSSPNAKVRADILDDFASTAVIAGGAWKLRLPPQTTLDPDKKEPIGATVNLTAGVDAFRSADVGKFITVYGGLIEVTKVTDRTHAVGEIRSVLSDSDSADPPAAPAGSWTIRVPSWSDDRGWPRAVEFHDGRLVFGGTRSQPTTWWESRSADYENFAIGSLADDAVQYTIANRAVNIIQWLRSLKNLFIGDAENEHSAKGKGVDNPIGGDEIPYVIDENDSGSMHTMTVVLQKSIFFLQAFARKLIEINYDFNADGYVGTNLMLYARHLGDVIFIQHPPVYAKEPNSVIHLIRKDGQMPCLTTYRKEQVAGWSRFVTDGVVESVVSIPDSIHGHDDVILSVKRVINGETKRFFEAVVFPTDRSLSTTTRAWHEFYTDCAVDGTLLAGERIIPVPHLEAKEVDAVIDGSFIGSFTVTGGQIDIGDSNISSTDRNYEVGLHYNALGKTMRPSIPNQVIDGLPRQWEPLFLRLVKTIGGKVNGKHLLYPASALDTKGRFTGDIRAHSLGEGEDLDGYVTFDQTDPYPMTITALYGTLMIGDYE